MARRENQGMQIAMILFIITTLIFMLTTYFAYSSSTRLAGENQELQSQVETAQSSARSAETLATQLKEKIGLDAGMADSEVTQQVDLAVQQNSVAPENQTFLGIIDELNKRVTELSGNLARANQDIQKIRQEKQQELAVEQQKLAAARESEALAQAKYNAAINENKEFFATNQAENQKLLAAASKSKTERDQAIKTADEQVGEASAKLKNAKAIIKARTIELQELTSDTPDQYDGRILGVVAATKRVLIDRGRADGLRPKMMLGVYDSEDTNVRTATKKASIEVTRILGDHRAEARITQTDHIHPIIRNDFIASPAWSPGESLGIALVGKMDFDKDGLDDREYIRNLITLGGGHIDAEEIDGKITGDVSVNTRYVVVGEGQLSADGLLQKADDLSIERMSVSELLDLMGYAGRSRAVTYDGVLRPGDFAPKPEGVIRSEPTSTKFRPRTPLKRRDRPRY